jgi:hypothetical protein
MMTLSTIDGTSSPFPFKAPLNIGFFTDFLEL